MTTYMFLHHVTRAILTLLAVLQMGSLPALSQEASDRERLSDKQVRQMLDWMESDSREIGKQARELEARSKALKAEMNFRVADNATQLANMPGVSTVAVRDLAVTLTFDDGKVLNFRQDQAKCFEDWVGETFTQKNCRADNGFWHVSFRPDTTSDRIEIVVELGHITNDVDAPFTAKGYRFELSDGDGLIAKVNVPVHFWGGRWRWQSEERPILARCEDLQDDPFVPQLEKSNLSGTPKKPSYDGPFTAPEFQRGMSNTGERADIGVITNWTAHCLLGGKIKEQHLIDLAADFSAAPIHLTWLESGELLDLRKEEYKTFNWHGNHRGRPDYIARQRVSLDDNPTYIKFECAHHPSLFYVPFQMTGDPFWLEELQTATLGCLLMSNIYRTNNESGEFLLINNGQLRAFAWVARDVFHSHYLTPDNAPDWLLPKSFWDRVVSDHLKEVTAIMADTSDTLDGIGRQRFHMMWHDRGGYFSMWMQDFNTPVFGLAVRAGYEDFRPWFEWLLVSAKERTSATGWDRRVPSFYNSDHDGELSFGKSEAMDIRRANNWSELFTEYQRGYASRFDKPIDQWPKDSYWEKRDIYSGYADYVFAGLVVAEWLGYDVKDNLDYLESARNAKARLGPKKTYDKWSFKR